MEAWVVCGMEFFSFIHFTDLLSPIGLSVGQHLSCMRSSPNDYVIAAVNTTWNNIWLSLASCIPWQEFMLKLAVTLDGLQLCTVYRSIYGHTVIIGKKITNFIFRTWHKVMDNLIHPDFLKIWHMMNLYVKSHSDRLQTAALLFVYSK